MSPGDDTAIPTIEPVFESDTRLRRRAQLSQEGHSTAGPVGSYIFHTLAADPRVKDVDVISRRPAEVEVTILSTEDEGLPGQQLLETVGAYLNAEEFRFYFVSDGRTINNCVARDVTVIVKEGRGNIASSQQILSVALVSFCFLSGG